MVEKASNSAPSPSPATVDITLPKLGTVPAVIVTFSVPYLMESYQVLNMIQ